MDAATTPTFASSTQATATTQPITMAVTVVPAPVHVQPAAMAWSSPQVVVAVIALIIASTLSWLTYGNAKRQRLAAERSRVLTEEKLRLDLFDKRFKIFLTVSDALSSHIEIDARPLDGSVVSQLFNDGQMSIFIFNPDVAEFIREVGLLASARAAAMGRHPPFDDRPHDVLDAKAEEVRQRLDKMRPTAHALFLPFLNFTGIAASPVTMPK